MIISILGYWGTLYYAPIYDFADQFFPSRHFMFECIHHHIFPLWIPYQSMGLPMHADPQANVFYLPVWVLSLFGEYNPIMWGIEYILHAFLGGLGFFLLSKRLTQNSLSSFLIAVCYMLSGFYVANMQHLSWIIAAAWVPWVLNGFMRIFTNPSLKNTFFLALSASLFITGAYPGFVLLCILLFSLYFLFFLFKSILKKNTLYLKRLAFFLFITLIFTVLLSFPALLSLLEAKAYMTRGLALDYEKTFEVVFTPQSLISLLFPYISTSEVTFTQTDSSMGNIYVGIFTLFFAGIGLLHKKSTVLKIFLWWGLICFLLSFGQYLPFHKWAFYGIPFINLIRIPAIFRLFTVMSLLLLAAVGFANFLQNRQKYKKSILLFSLMSGGIMLLVAFFVYFKVGHFSWNTLQQTSLFYKMFIESLLIFIITGIFSTFFLYFRSQKICFLLSILMISDMTFNAWQCKAVGMRTDFSNQELKSELSRFSKEFPPPRELTTAVKINHQHQFFALWRNVGIFSKQIESDSYNGFFLRNSDEMNFPYYELKKPLILSAAVFFPKSVIYSDKPILFNTDTSYTCQKEDIFCAKTSSDMDTIIIKQFHPNKMIFQTDCKESRPLVLAQNDYPGWQALDENGNSLKIKCLNTAMMSVIVPAGIHQIIFSYSKPILKIGFFVEIIVFIGMCIAGGILQLKTKARIS